MGFPIPDPYVWDESFKVFYQLLDDKHKQIFQGVFDCAKDPSSAAKLQKLIEVTAKHFSDEENMMQQSKYSGYPPHKKAHEEFLGKLRGLRAPLDTAGLDYCKDWLVQHIKTIDFKYKGKL
uniref:Myohemerythrin n=1 Tax=Sipunculus nudus TaxID=6446 RepID=HEMTM_SIPNU|nr:RecName: Full=Myohemerythrin; Short=MHr; Short=myoHr [Sipunculus nudus]